MSWGCPHSQDAVGRKLQSSLNWDEILVLGWSLFGFKQMQVRLNVASFWSCWDALGRSEQMQPKALSDFLAAKFELVKSPAGLRPGTANCTNMGS